MTAAAILGAITAFAQFLNTPPGQVFATRQNDLMDKLFTLLHLHLSSIPVSISTPTQTKVP